MGSTSASRILPKKSPTCPGSTPPPRGCLLLARSKGDLAGCIALRDHGANACEMKRLYVRPQYRATGLGRRLAESAIAHARRMAYARIVLDTLPGMAAAQGLYASLGFREITAYYQNPLAGARFLARDLTGKE